MQLEVNWPGNDPEQPGRLVIGNEPIALTVRVCDPWGKPLQKECIVQELRGKTDPRDLVPSPGHAKFSHYQIAPEAIGSRLLVRTREQLGIPELRVEVISRATQRSEQAVRHAAQLACLFALVSVLILVPQTEEPVRKLSALSVAGVSFASLFAAFMRRVMKQLVPGALVALVMVGGALGAWSNGAIVLNQSLEPLANGEGGGLLPGQYGVVFGDVLKPDQCFIDSSSSKRGCLKPDPLPANKPVWVHLIPKWIIHEIGCFDVGLPTDLHKQWRALGHCKPDGNALLNHIPLQTLAMASNARAPANADLSPASDTGDLEPEASVTWALATDNPDNWRSKYRTLRFKASESQTIQDLSLRLDSPDRPLRSIWMPRLSALSDILSPAYRNRYDGVEATLLESSNEIGKIELPGPPAVHPEASEPDALCWFAPVGRHSSRYVVWATAGQPDTQNLGAARVSSFRALAPDLVSAIPICRPAGYKFVDAELTLAPNWSPSTKWTLTLPAEAAIRQLRIIDSTGVTWGDVTCPLETRDASQAWEIGPLFAPNSKDALGRLDSNNKSSWHAAPSGGGRAFIWGCWPAAELPESWTHAEQRWILIRSPDKSRAREFEGHMNRVPCYLYPDGSPALKVDCDQDHREAEKRAHDWYEGWGPAHCDPPPHSFLCSRKKPKQ